MHIITVSVTVSLIKIQRLMILKKVFFYNRIREKQINLKKKDSQKDNNIFWVGPVLGG